MLFRSNADVNVQDEDGDTALIVASYYGNGAITKLLLERNPGLDHQNKEGWTALMWASNEGHQSFVELLLERNPNLDAQNKEGTALILASKKGHTDIVKNLLRKGADMTIKQNGDGKTAKDWAKKKKFVNLVNISLHRYALY